MVDTDMRDEARGTWARRRDQDYQKASATGSPSEDEADDVEPDDDIAAVEAYNGKPSAFDGR